MSLEEAQARHKKDLRALDGDKRATLKKGKATAGKGKKAKEKLAVVEAEFDTKLKELEAKHAKEIAELSGSGASDGNTDVKDTVVTDAGGEAISAEADERERKQAKARRKRKKAKEKERERELQIERENAEAGPSAPQMEVEVIQNQLLELLSEVLDEGTVFFLLDTLESCQEDEEALDWEGEVQPLLESFVEDAGKVSEVLGLLQSDETVVRQTKDILQARHQVHRKVHVTELPSNPRHKVSIEEKCPSTTTKCKRRVAGEKRYPNPPFDLEKFHITYERWKESVGKATLKEGGVSEADIRKTLEVICSNFPRGSNCGSLLWEPVVEDTPLERRGISMKWLSTFFSWVSKQIQYQKLTIPTRLFVSLFIEPLVLAQEEADALPLYYFVPPPFRGPPRAFISHGWDSWLRHLLYFPATSVPGQMAQTLSSEKTFLWLDIFAIVQDPGSVKQQSEVDCIGDVVKSIGQTCLVVPGHGSLAFALLPARRSWCCLEIAYTHNLSARVGMNKSLLDKDGSDDTPGNIRFHKRLIQDIGQLHCIDAQTRCQTEKTAIQDLLERELGLDKADRMVRRAILKAFQERYSSAKFYGWGTIPALYSQAVEQFEERGVI